MGKKAVYKYLSFMMLVFTVIVTAFIIFGLFGGYSNPATGTAMALLVYALPLFIVVDVVLLIFWLIRRSWHWAAIPAVALLCCLPYAGTLYQFSIFSGYDDTRSGIKVATYNVARFGREINGAKAESILSIMRRQQTDILCLQEYQENSGDTVNSGRYKGFFAFNAMGFDDMMIFSRHPIVSSEIIDFGPNTNNSGMWADIDINGKVVRVFNVHLQTTGINRTQRQLSKQAAQGSVVDNSRVLRSFYGSYTYGMGVRAQQADLVRSEIERSPHPIIVCGDFNDVPYSYVYRTMKGDLVDGFKECGKGWMYTFREGKKLVRIDYIFHSESMEGCTYYKEDVNYSDHLPVFMTISM